jgi:signal transduction histidine kinase
VNFKEILSQLNIFAQCKKYGLPLWQCPQFLFLVMGIAIDITAIVTYLLGTRYVEDPSFVALIVLLLSVLLLTLSFTIIRSLERIAEANRMKSEFISIVSHQLRSPLSNLKWSIELLMSGRLGEIKGKQKEYFRILADNTERMGELVSDLLTVSRIEQGRLPLQKTEFSLVELTKKIVEKYRPYALASNVEIDFQAEESLPRVIADLSQVKSVIENLLDNAVRYIKGGGEVKIKIEKEDKKLLFEIKDTGVGIPQKDQKHIFQKFFRSMNVLKYQTQGSGLGLYIAKSIIEKSGGKINFKSQEGKGSTFYFTLPILTK